MDNPVASMMVEDLLNGTSERADDPAMARLVWERLPGGACVTVSELV